MGKEPGAGELNERVTIQRRTVARDAIGGQIETWQVRAQLWAKVQPMSAGEQYRRQQIQAKADWKLTIRYNGDVLPSDRVSWRGHTAEIRGILNPDMRRRFLELSCEELQATPTQVHG